MAKAVVLCLAFSAVTASPYPYDHQTQVYRAAQPPVTVTGAVTITPVFSPEYSCSVLTSLVESATSSIDIGTPGFSSWSGCTPFTDVGCTAACTPSKQRNESFPIFPALLNALHKGIKVRILTNNYETPDCVGTISPLSFLALNGATVVYYATTTFIHEKYISIDGKKTAVTSINFSRASMTRNREAGGVLEGEAVQPLIAMMAKVYSDDIKRGTELVVNTSAFSDADMAIILDDSEVPVVIPAVSPTQASYYSPPTPAPITSNATVTVSTSPDFSAETLLDFIKAANKTLDVMIYQITDPAIADALIALTAKGVAVRLLVSSAIYGSSDCVAANDVYQRLYFATGGKIIISKTSRHYTYSHQKFWIVDGINMAWSTGNWSPTDYPFRTVSPIAEDFPPFGADGWTKANRDYTVYVKGSVSVAKAYQNVIDGDIDPTGTFPSPVYPFDPKYPVACGDGR